MTEARTLVTRLDGGAVCSGLNVAGMRLVPGHGCAGRRK
jgi:hypothetical protein